MDFRELLLRRELEKIYQELNIIYECPYLMLNEDL